MRFNATSLRWKQQLFMQFTLSSQNRILISQHNIKTQPSICEAVDPLYEIHSIEISYYLAAPQIQYKYLLTFSCSPARFTTRPKPALYRFYSVLNLFELYDCMLVMQNILASSFTRWIRMLKSYLVLITLQLYICGFLSLSGSWHRGRLPNRDYMFKVKQWTQGDRSTVSAAWVFFHVIHGA